MKLKIVHQLNTRSLHIAVLKERHIVPETKLIKSTHLPVSVRNRLAIAHHCPYRNNELNLETVNMDQAMRSKILGSSSTLFTANSIVSSSKLLKNRTITEGNSIFNNLGKSQMVHLEKDCWISKEDVITGEDGTKFLHASTYGKYLNLIFGIGGWSLYPLEDAHIDKLSEGFFVSRKFGFVSHGSLMSDTYTEFVLTRKTARYGVESIRSKAISVFAQKIGLGLNLQEI